MESNAVTKMAAATRGLVPYLNDAGDGDDLHMIMHRHIGLIGGASMRS